MKPPDVQTIKERLTIEHVGGVVSPGWAAGKSCKSPFRQDRTPSFSVFDNGRAWKDHATGESGDVVSFYTKATGLPFTDAVERLAVMAGIYSDEPTRMPEPIKELRLPEDLHTGSSKELATVAKLRGLNIEAVAETSARGLLRFGTVCGSHCWLLTDKHQKSAQARRMTGEAFTAVKNLPSRKAHTLAGSCQSWPLGLLEASQMPFLALVEGGPDLLAAIHFAQAEGAAERVGVIAMLGASNSIPGDALIHFTGKRVRIFAHDDDAGRAAAIRWKSQLQGVGARIDIFECGGVPLHDGKTSGDLNDLARADADFWEENRTMLDHLFDFVEG